MKLEIAVSHESNWQVRERACVFFFNFNTNLLVSILALHLMHSSLKALFNLPKGIAGGRKAEFGHLSLLRKCAYREIKLHCKAVHCVYEEKISGH